MLALYLRLSHDNSDLTVLDSDFDSPSDHGKDEIQTKSDSSSSSEPPSNAKDTDISTERRWSPSDDENDDDDTHKSCCSIL